MKPFGLTGNIGCGKSKVAAALAERPNISTCSTDDIAKEFLRDPTYWTEIESILQADVYTNDVPDFKRMAQIIFNDAEKKKRLEALIHPLVWERARAITSNSSPGKIWIVESALIYEVGSEHEFEAVIAVVCSQAEQIKRLQASRNMSIEEIRERIMSLKPTWEKAMRADIVIDTDCDLPELRQRVETLYHQLCLLAQTRQGTQHV